MDSLEKKEQEPLQRIKRGEVSMRSNEGYSSRAKRRTHWREKGGADCAKGGSGSVYAVLYTKIKALKR